ncbi:acyltransferase [Sneathiella limimaris]|uniref:acyltransferase n=1 Tax=Sneathiella limimaris TaxID=1964213 RepID=UPI00146E70D6|nr:acyltransferase [Sneathiella limimaris]
MTKDTQHDIPTTIQEGSTINVGLNEQSIAFQVGNNGIVRSGSVIYANVTAGDYFQTGHNVMIRSDTEIGDHVVVGTNTVIEGTVKIGNFVKIEANCFIPTHVTIGTRVFIGPNVVMTNDMYPLKLRDEYIPKGPTLEDGVTIGGNVTICPGVTIGKGSFIAAGAVVTKDVPPMSLAMGNPARTKPLPDHLRENNMALSWRKYLKA